MAKGSVSYQTKAPYYWSNYNDNNTTKVKPKPGRGVCLGLGFGFSVLGFRVWGVSEDREDEPDEAI